MGDMGYCWGNTTEVLNLITAVAKLIAGNWKSSEAPWIKEWLVNVNPYVFLLSKLSAVYSYRAGNMNAIRILKKQYTTPWCNDT